MIKELGGLKLGNVSWDFVSEVNLRMEVQWEVTGQCVISLKT